MSMRHPGLTSLHITSILLCTAACETAREPAHPTAPSRETSQSVTEADLVIEQVELRPGATADIHVRMFTNATQPCSDPARTALLVHGVNATAASWARFAEALLEGNPADRLCAIAAMDQAGHGASGLPSGVLFGELLVEDYARTLIHVLERLEARKFRPSILVGHSQGTSTIQTAQQFLRDEGTTLRTRFGIRDVVLLGVQGPRELRVEFLLPPDQIMAIIGSYLTSTPERGTYIRGPAELNQQLWYLTTQLTFSTRTPSVATIAAGGWSADAPLFAVFQAAGLSGFDTPSVDRGIFAAGSGTELAVIDFADDPWSLTERAGEIYEYLADDPSRTGFTSLTDPLGDAVHDYMITHPGVVRSAIPLPRRGASRSVNR